MRYAWDAVRRRPGRSTATALGIGLATGPRGPPPRALGGDPVERLAAGRFQRDRPARDEREHLALVRDASPRCERAHAFPAAIGRSADPNVATVSPWLDHLARLRERDPLRGGEREPERRGGPRRLGSHRGGDGRMDPAGRTSGSTRPAPWPGAGSPRPGDPLYANGTYTGALDRRDRARPRPRRGPPRRRRATSSG